MRFTTPLQFFDASCEVFAMFHSDDFDPADLDTTPRPFVGQPNDPEHPGEFVCDCGKCEACQVADAEFAASLRPCCGCRKPTTYSENYLPCCLAERCREVAGEFDADAYFHELAAGL